MSLKQPNLSLISRRHLLSRTTVTPAAAASMLSGNHASACPKLGKGIDKSA
jgi:hypothetical protein